MKTLKNKIIEELKMKEHEEALSGSELSHDTLELVYKLSKTLCYLEKAENIIEGIPVK